jgi:hypothetical protein
MTDTLGYNAVVFAKSGAGFAIGDRGRVARWTGSLKK